MRNLQGFEMSNTQKLRFACNIENNTPHSLLVSSSFQIITIQRDSSKIPGQYISFSLAIRYSYTPLYSIY